MANKGRARLRNGEQTANKQGSTIRLTPWPSWHWNRGNPHGRGNIGRRQTSARPMAVANRRKPHDHRKTTQHPGTRTHLFYPGRS